MTLPRQSCQPFPDLFQNPSATEAAAAWPNWSRIPFGWRMFGMFLLCLFPRAWAAILVDSICHDGYYYISVANACQDGNWANAFSYLELNIFPLILMGLNSLGFDWMLGGMLWSLLVSSLVVLPMFGWVRRLFSDQVAWAACFLYSVNAEFVEFSMEPVRDPTFWLLLNLCLYATLRAISEAKIRWFFAGGLSLALAVHTRSEGWLLAIPFAMWLARQLVVQVNARKRLATGGLVWIAVTPLLILLVNVTVLKNEPEWKLGRLSHFTVGWNWIVQHITPTVPAETPTPVPAETQPAIAGLPLDTHAPESKHPVSIPAPLPVPTAIAESPTNAREAVSVRFFFKNFASALEQINLGLVVFGLFCLRREHWDWDRGALFLMGLTLACAIWILYDQSGALNGRYFFPIYFTIVPYSSLGLLLVLNTFWKGATRSTWSWLKPQHAVAFIFCLAIGLGWADALTTYHGVRNREAKFGEQLEKTHGPFQFVVTDLKSTRAGYHAQNDNPGRLHNWGTMEWQFKDKPYDLLILHRGTTPKENLPDIDAAARRMGLEPLPFPNNKFVHDRFFVYVRPRANAPSRSVAEQAESAAGYAQH